VAGYGGGVSTEALCGISRAIPYRCRRAHRAFAGTFGFFWIPCQLCGRNFGGHEWRDIDGNLSTRYDEAGKGTAICPVCTRAGLAGVPWPGNVVPYQPG
jgi:hypothetical protein